MNASRTILVYDDFSFNTPVLLGRLFIDPIKGGESYSFEYDTNWLKQTSLSVSLDPALAPCGGRQFPYEGRIFGMFADSSPDRWGRLLLTKKDLIELWKRIVFSMAVSNTDDHLRNHAFILEKKGWTLSPLYDVNPVPYGDELALNVNEDDNRISVPLALDAAVSFGITKEEAQNFSAEILHIVRGNWENLAKHYNIPRGKIDDMRPAFSACY